MLFIINVKLLYWNYWNWELNSGNWINCFTFTAYLSGNAILNYSYLSKQLLIVMWPLTNGRTGGETFIW